MTEQRLFVVAITKLWNHFLEIQAHDIRLGAIQESMDPAQELWTSIRPLGAQDQGPEPRARAPPPPTPPPRPPRRLGCESDREISMAPACVILSLGLWSLISGPGLGRVPLGLVFDLCRKIK